MPNDISPESEQFIQVAIAKGQFQSRGQALDAAVALLKRRHELLEHIERGTQQLRAGVYREFNNETLREWFAALQSELGTGSSQARHE